MAGVRACTGNAQNVANGPKSAALSGYVGYSVFCLVEEPLKTQVWRCRALVAFSHLHPRPFAIKKTPKMLLGIFQFNSFLYQLLTCNT